MNTSNDEMSNVSNDNNIGSSTNIDSINHISNNLGHIGSADNINHAIISASHFNSANNLVDPENENHNDHIGLKNVHIANKNMNNYSSLSNENTIDDNGNDMNFLNDDDNDNCNESNENNHNGNAGVTIEGTNEGGNNDYVSSDKAEVGDIHNNVAGEQNGGSDIASSGMNNTGLTPTAEEAQLNGDKKSAPNGNYKNAFFKNVDDVRSFERGILYLTDEEFNYISNTVNLLGFRFFEIPSEKSKSEKRNTYSAISKRHLNEIKNLRCSLSNNIYDAGKRKSKKSFNRYYSKDETSSTTTKDNNDTQREITRRRGAAYSNYDDDNKSSLNGDDNKYGNVSNNHVSNGTAALASSAYRGGAYSNKVGSSSGSGVNAKMSESDKIVPGRNNSMVKKGSISKGEMDSGSVNKNAYGAYPSVGKGKSSKSVGSSSSKNNAAMHHSNYKHGAAGAGAAVAGGKEALKKRQRSSNNSILEDDTVDEYEQHKRTYKKRIYKSGNPWKNWCFKILHKLKKKEICCWFLKPVNPELDGIPNYFNVIKNPMDFETIENKLLTNKYKNPFEWQQDVRQIFFNAFTYHKVKNCVWNDAYKLAKEFDKLVKQHTEMKNILNECTKGSNSVYLDMNKYNEILAEKYEYDENLNHTSSSSSYTGSSSEEISSDEYHGNKRYNRNNSASNAYTVRKKNMMMSGGVAAANHAAYHNMDPSNHMYGAPNRKGSAAAGDNRFNKMNKQMSSMSSKNARDKFVNSKKDNNSGYGVGNNNSSGNIHMNSNNNSIEFEPPSMGTIPEPPGIQKIGANDKGLNNYQVNLLFKNLRRLAPNQRRAALEIIQDDLGILAENHMFDRFFTFDTDLLSIEKQKRIFLYINHMGRINLEQYKASLIPSDQIGTCTMPKGKMPMKNMNNKNYLNSSSTLGNNTNNSNNPHFDKRRTNRYLSSSSNSSDSSSSNSSDSSTYSTSSEDSESEEDSDSDMDSDSYDKKKVKRQLSSNERKKEVITNKYFDNNRRKTLPQYKPIDENKKNLQLRDDVMGMHADFLASMDGPKNGKKDPKSSGSAWPEWKGQVIQQAILTQHQSSVPLNKKELIAEGYDAKI
ncbi:bromodomain protein [Plasmodium vivax India VII]|uniref:Bromodomain protein n=3 Tax=Plasmodium vivax TaxID=5855 RepID=A0A0J9T4Y2_PLAVI|nr:bromodomain protein [Plasmodium vivax India VII]KMZ84395.1 bromodomain protein [Plasmodium vivax Brazil I]KMZ90174.1 bromodomain protein [Plasmodium vivax Mauritania I]